MFLTRQSHRFARLIFTCLVMLAVLLAVKSHAQDVPSGFLPGNISVFAGHGPNGYTDGSPANSVQFLNIATGGVAVDSKGNVYIATYGTGDSVYVVYGGATIPAVLSAVVPSPGTGDIYQNIIGGGNNATTPVNNGIGGPASGGYFGTIGNLFIDASDNLYITVLNGDIDTVSDSRIYEVASGSSTLSLVAGTGPVSTSADDVKNDADATTVTLNNPLDAQVDKFGNVYIADTMNFVIRVVYKGGVGGAVPEILKAQGITSPTAGHIYTIAGKPFESCAATPCGDNVAALSTTFAFPVSVSVDGDGNIYIADEAARTVRVLYANTAGKVPAILKNIPSPTVGNIYTVAGQEFASCTAAPCGDDGLALQGTFVDPYGTLRVDAGGNIYISDYSANAVRKIDTSGYLSTVAGIVSPNAGSLAATSGPATSVNMSGPAGIDFDPQGNLYVADQNNDLVWKALALQPQIISFNTIGPVTYGVGSIQLTATASSGLPVSYSVTSGPGTIAAGSSTLDITGAGTVTVVASQAGDTTTYAPAPDVTHTVTVNPATLTVTANNASKIYLADNPTFTATYSLANGDTLSSVASGQIALISTTATSASHAGDYPITIDPGTLKVISPNYNPVITFVPGTLKITGATPQTITFAPLTPVTYGQTTSLPLTATASSGLAVQYSITQGTAAVVNGSTLMILSAGTVTITANQAGSDTYAAAGAVTHTLVIEPAPLTVTGPVFSLPIGSAINPTAFPPPTITGLVGGDTQAALVLGSPAYSTTATAASPAGNYPIQVAVGSLRLDPSVAQDYTLSLFNPGTLTIVAAPQTIVFSQVNNATYGDILNLLATSSSGLPITYTVSGPAAFQGGSKSATANSGVLLSGDLFTGGAGTLAITATQPGNSNYAPAPPVTQTVTIAPAPLMIVANSFTREFGADNPVLTYQVGAPAGQPGSFVNNDTDNPTVITGIPAVATDAGPNSPAGMYAIAISTGTLSASNYNFRFVDGTLTVLPAGSYTITSDPKTLTIPSGQSRAATITITSQNLYQGTVTLSCGQLPANVTCIFSPSTYTFTGSDQGNGGANVAVGTLTVNTVGGQTVVGAISGGRTSISSASLLLLPGGLAGLLVALSLRRLSKKNIGWRTFVLLMLGAGAIGLSSCGSTSGSTMGKYAATGTSNIVIQGTGTSLSGTGSVSSSLSLSITIQ